MKSKTRDNIIDPIFRAWDEDTPMGLLEYISECFWSESSIVRNSYFQVVPQKKAFTLQHTVKIVISAQLAGQVDASWPKKT